MRRRRVVMESAMGMRDGRGAVFIGDDFGIDVEGFREPRTRMGLGRLFEAFDPADSLSHESEGHLRGRSHGHAANDAAEHSSRHSATETTTSAAA